eukprot:4952282-Pyramimonas_sp.AAC.1
MPHAPHKAAFKLLSQCSAPRPDKPIDWLYRSILCHRAMRQQREWALGVAVGSTQHERGQFRLNYPSPQNLSQNYEDGPASPRIASPAGPPTHVMTLPGPHRLR